MYCRPYAAANFYQRALLANALTSALRLHQRLPRFQLSRAFLAQALQEDSCHYLLYSLILVNSYPITSILSTFQILSSIFINLSSRHVPYHVVHNLFTEDQMYIKEVWNKADKLIWLVVLCSLSYCQEYYYCRNTLKYCDVILGPYHPPLPSRLFCLSWQAECFGGFFVFIMMFLQGWFM